MTRPWVPHRYIPLTAPDRAHMLQTVGVAASDDLFASIPTSLRLARDLRLPPALDEQALVRELEALSAHNAAARMPCFLGAGSYEHFIPSVVRHLAGRAEFVTAYTPYQAEIMQGELQAIFEYQSLIAALLRMDVANASMYDGASATAEACVMARDLTHRDRVLISTAVHPEYRQVLRTYTRHLGIEVVDLPYRGGITPADLAHDLIGEHAAALVVQHPNFFGRLEDVAALGQAAHDAGALLVLTTADPTAFGLLEPPGALGADIVAGEGQLLGNPLNYGGPNLGVLATRREFVRRMPGRLVGETVDADGRRGFVLTLQTREQHIRREKATSNICSNEALVALAAAVYMAALGPQGLRTVAETAARKAHYAQARIAALPGFSPAFPGPSFHEFVVRTPVPPAMLNRRLQDRGIVGGLPLGRFYPELDAGWLVCVTEARTRPEIDALVDALAEVTR